MSEEEVDENGEDVETIYVGSKPLMSYVMASMSIFLDENPSKIKIAARGRAISRAVDTAEVLRRRYLKGIVDVEKVDISTDEVEDKETGDVDRVSSITIILNKIRELPTGEKERLKESI